MTAKRPFTRRAALAAGAMLPLAGAMLGAGGPASAGAQMLGPDQPRVNRFRLGRFEVTALLAATRPVESPHKIFGLTTPDDEFAQVSAQNFIPADVAQFFFTPVLVNTGTKLVLFDTGPDPKGMTAALRAAGYGPEQVDLVVLTHMHPDHIGGLMMDGKATFANAAYATGAVEYDAWAKAGNALFDANVRPLAPKMAMLDDAATVTPGITAILAPGHTPGHMAFLLQSGHERLLLIADTANHYVWSLAYPDWQVRFDADKEMAAKTRHRILGLLANEKMPFIGYHMPFPALGYVERRGEGGFRYVAASYQMVLPG